MESGKGLGFTNLTNMAQGYRYCENLCGYSACLYSSDHYHCHQCGFGTNEMSQITVHRETCPGQSASGDHCREMADSQLRGGSNDSNLLLPAPPSDSDQQSYSTSSSQGTLSSSASPSPNAVEGSTLYHSLMTPQPPLFNSLLGNQESVLYGAQDFNMQPSFSPQTAFPLNGYQGFCNADPTWASANLAERGVSSPHQLLEKGPRCQCLEGSLSDPDGGVHICNGGRLSSFEDAINYCTLTSSCKPLERDPSGCLQTKANVAVDPQGCFYSQSVGEYNEHIEDHSPQFQSQVNTYLLNSATTSQGKEASSSCVGRTKEKCSSVTVMERPQEQIKQQQCLHIKKASDNNGSARQHSSAAAFGDSRIFSGSNSVATEDMFCFEFGQGTLDSRFSNQTQYLLPPLPTPPQSERQHHHDIGHLNPVTHESTKLSSIPQELQECQEILSSALEATLQCDCDGIVSHKGECITHSQKDGYCQLQNQSCGNVQLQQKAEGDANTQACLQPSVVMEDDYVHPPPLVQSVPPPLATAFLPHSVRIETSVTSTVGSRSCLSYTRLQDLNLHKQSFHQEETVSDKARSPLKDVTQQKPSEETNQKGGQAQCEHHRESNTVSQNLVSDVQDSEAVEIGYCFVCNADVSNIPSYPEGKLIRVQNNFPVTSRSRVPVVTKLAEVLVNVMRGVQVPFPSEFLCKKCFVLIETIDSLEVDLASTREDLQMKFKRTITEISLTEKKEEQKETWGSQNKQSSDTSENTSMMKVENSASTIPKESQNFIPPQPVCEDDQEIKIANSEIDDIIKNGESDKSLPHEQTDKQNTSEIKDDAERRKPKRESKRRKHHKNKKKRNHKKKHRVKHDSTKQSEDNKPACSKTELKKDLEEMLDKKLETKDTASVSQSVDSPMKPASTLFHCDICGKDFKMKAYFRKHHQMHTNGTDHCCKICGRQFLQKRTLEHHVLCHKGQRPFQCEQCGRTFIQKALFQQHLRQHSGDFAVTCDICGHGFMRRQVLEMHRRTHTGEKPFVCEVCGQRFSIQANLTAHLPHCSGKYPFNCTICSKGFVLKKTMENHIRAHKGEYSSRCDSCGKGFLKKSDLVAHLRVHSGEKPFMCEICGKGFSSSSNYNLHVKCHSNEKPVTCQVCGKGFSRKWSLKMHMNQHLGHKPYSCSRCKKSFTSSYSLKRHERFHEQEKANCDRNACKDSVQQNDVGEKKNQCSFCPKHFAARRSLVKHLKTHSEQKLNINVTIQHENKRTHN